MSAINEREISLIRDEDLLKKMWQETEDFGRKKEIRAHMYKLREARLKDLYCNTDVKDIQISSNSKTSFNQSSHADSLADHSFASLKSKEIRDSESPTRDVMYRITGSTKNQGWNVSKIDEVSRDGKTHRIVQSAETSGTEVIPKGKLQFEARNQQESTSYQDGDEKNFIRSQGISSNSLVRQEATGGDDHSSFRNYSTKSSSSSRTVTEKKTSSEDVDNVTRKQITPSENVITKTVKVYTTDAPQELKSHPGYVEGHTKITRETKTLADGTVITTNKYETTGANETVSSSSNRFTTSSNDQKTSSEKIIQSTQDTNRKTKPQSKYWVEKTHTIPDNSINTQNITTSTNIHGQRNIDKSSEFKTSSNQNVNERYEIIVTDDVHNNKFAKNTDINERTNEQSYKRNHVDNEVINSGKIQQKTSTTQDINSIPLGTPIEIEINVSKMNLKDEKEYKTNYSKTETQRMQDKKVPQRQVDVVYDVPQPVPVKSKLTDGQYETTYRTDYNNKRISVEVSPTHDAFARSLRAVSPDRLSSRSNSRNLKNSNTSLRSSSSPEKTFSDYRHPSRISPERQPNGRCFSPSKKTPERFSSTETITYKSPRTSSERYSPDKITDSKYGTERRMHITTTDSTRRHTDRKPSHPNNDVGYKTTQKNEQIRTKSTSDYSIKETRKVSERSSISPMRNTVSHELKKDTPKKSLPADKPLKRTDTYEERCRQILGISKETNERRRSSLDKLNRRSSSGTVTVTESLSRTVLPTHPKKSPSPSKKPSDSSETPKQKSPLREFPAQIRKTPENTPLDKPNSTRPKKTDVTSISEFPSQIRKSPEKTRPEKSDDLKRRDSSHVTQDISISIKKTAKENTLKRKSSAEMLDGDSPDNSCLPKKHSPIDIKPMGTRVREHIYEEIVEIPTTTPKEDSNESKPSFPKETSPLQEYPSQTRQTLEDQDIISNISNVSTRKPSESNIIVDVRSTKITLGTLKSDTTEEYDRTTSGRNISNETVPQKPESNKLKPSIPKETSPLQEHPTQRRMTQEDQDVPRKPSESNTIDLEKNIKYITSETVRSDTTDDYDRTISDRNISNEKLSQTIRKSPEGIKQKPYLPRETSPLQEHPAPRRRTQEDQDVPNVPRKPSESNITIDLKKGTKYITTETLRSDTTEKYDRTTSDKNVHNENISQTIRRTPESDKSKPYLPKETSPLQEHPAQRRRTQKEQDVPKVPRKPSESNITIDLKKNTKYITSGTLRNVTTEEYDRTTRGKVPQTTRRSPESYKFKPSTPKETTSLQEYPSQSRETQEEIYDMPNIPRNLTEPNIKVDNRTSERNVFNENISNENYERRPNDNTLERQVPKNNINDVSETVSITELSIITCDEDSTDRRPFIQKSPKVNATYNKQEIDDDSSPTERTQRKISPTQDKVSNITIETLEIIEKDQRKPRTEKFPTNEENTTRKIETINGQVYEQDFLEIEKILDERPASPTKNFSKPQQQKFLTEKKTVQNKRDQNTSEKERGDSISTEKIIETNKKDKTQNKTHKITVDSYSSNRRPVSEKPRENVNKTRSNETRVDKNKEIYEKKYVNQTYEGRTPVEEPLIIKKTASLLYSDDEDDKKNTQLLIESEITDRQPIMDKTKMKPTKTHKVTTSKFIVNEKQEALKKNNTTKYQPTKKPDKKPLVEKNQNKTSIGETEYKDKYKRKILKDDNKEKNTLSDIENFEGPKDNKIHIRTHRIDDSLKKTTTKNESDQKTNKILNKKTVSPKQPVYEVTKKKQLPGPQGRPIKTTSNEPVKSSFRPSKPSLTQKQRIIVTSKSKTDTLKSSTKTKKLSEKETIITDSEDESIPDSLNESFIDEIDLTVDVTSKISAKERQTPSRSQSKPELIDKAKTPKPKLEKRCISTKSIIINNNERGITVDLQRSMSSREPSPDRVCPHPVTSDEDGIAPRYPDNVVEPDEVSIKRKTTKLFDTSIKENEEGNVHKIMEVADDNNQRVTLIDRVDKDDDSLLTVNKKIDKFLNTVEKLTEKPIVDISEPAPKVARPQFEVDEDLREDDCLLSVSDKVNKFITEAEHLTSQKNVQNKTVKNINIKSDVSNKINKFTSQNIVTDLDAPRGPADVDNETKFMSNIQYTEKSTPKFTKIDQDVFITTECDQLEKEEDSFRITKPRLSPNDTESDEDIVTTKLENFEHQSSKKTVVPPKRTVSTDKKPTNKDSSIYETPRNKIPPRSDSFKEYSPKNRRPSQEEKVILSTIGRLRSSESIKKAKAIFDKNESTNKEVNRQKDILSRSSVLEVKANKTIDRSTLTPKRLDFSPNDVRTPEKYKPDFSTATPYASKQRSSPDKDVSHKRTPSPGKNVPGYTKPLVSTYNLPKQRSSPDKDIPGYMKPTHNQQKPRSSPEMDLKSPISSSNSQKPRFSPDKDIPHYMKPLDHSVRPQVSHKENVPSRESFEIQEVETFTSEEDLPGYMKPLDRTPRPSSPKKDVYDKPTESLETPTKFGITLKKTDSSKGITNTIQTSTSIKKQPEISKTIITEEEIDKIFDLQILEDLLLKLTGYEIRRKIRTQIRLVKKLISENKLEITIQNIQNKIKSATHSTETTQQNTKKTTEYQSTYTRKTSPQRKSIDNKLFSHTDINDKNFKEKTSEYISSYTRKESVSSTTRSGSPGSRVSISPERRSPDRKSTSKLSTDSEIIQEKSNISNQSTYKRTDRRKHEETANKVTNVNVLKTSLKKTEPRSKTPVTNGQPEWVSQRNLKKVNTTEGRTATISSSCTTSVKKQTTRSSSPTKEVVKSTDIITSSYGVGPTDENGTPLFGLRALRAQKKAENTKVQGTVISSQYYSETGKEPIGQISVTKYSSNPRDLEPNGDFSNDDGILSITTTQKFGFDDAPSLDELTNSGEEICDIKTGKRKSASKSSTVVRRNSVKALTQKFVENAAEESRNERQSSYPKAGLILRSSSFKNDTAAYETDEINTKSTDERLEESISMTTSSNTKYLSSGTFLRNKSKVTGVQDVITRMKAEDIEDDETAEDVESKGLLNKFLGSQVILSGIEGTVTKSATATARATSCSSSSKSTTRVTTVIMENGKKVNKTQVFEHPISDEVLENVWDEQILRYLLDQSTDYDERKRIRSKLRLVMAEQEACTELVKQASQDQSSQSIDESIETNRKVGSEGSTTSTRVTTRVTTQQQSSKKPLSPFAKFRQLDKQNSLNTPPSTPRTPGGSPLFTFTDAALSQSANTIKDRLLHWCRMKTKEYENIQLDNFSTSWADGLAFCALIHHFLPEAFDYHALTPKERRHNFTLAFRVADEKADIAPLLDVDDMVATRRPDWKCVFTYVQSIYRRFKDED
ncbi:hypothetical protein HHI36_016074 [Cryptolaemus montrouzieri]|uniref:Calponin-homology (CH) domain-containing protein n=1 Tax=Cryptolaemus montrouzieri TaxID=559131 RepID=A0ABD2N7K2_9CUCU